MGYFDGLNLDEAFKALQPPAPKDPGALRHAADTGLSLARGATQGVKMLADVAGAGNPVSEKLQQGIDWLSENFSDYSKWEQLTSAQDMRAAALSGSTWEEIKAAARSFAKRPVDFLAEAAGTSIPTVAAAFLPGGQGALLGRVAMLGMGAAQGTGAVKGQIFDEVQQAWEQAGSTPEEARERAEAAQEYFGSNSGQIALGTALGALAGGTGVEAGILAGRARAAAAAPTAGIMARAASRVPRFAREGLKESIPEAAQGGQEQLAANLALDREGFETPAGQGVAGAAVLEGLAGGAFGAAASPMTRVRAASAASDRAMRDLAQAQTVDEMVDAATRAADVPLEAAAPLPSGAAPAAGPLEPGAPTGAPSAAFVETPAFAERVTELRAQVADPGVRQQIRDALGPEALNEVLRAASVADREDLGLPEKTRERVLALAETIVSRAVLRPVSRPGVETPSPAALPRAPLRVGLDTSPTGTIRVDPEGRAAPETRADAISTRQRRQDGMEASVPRGAAPAAPAPAPRAPRSRIADALAIDPAAPNAVQQFVERMRGRNTMAARAFVQDFEAGRISRQDVLDLLVPKREATPDERLAAAAGQAPRQAGGLVGPDGQPLAGVDARAHEAATSPTNDLPEPTDAQQKAGNYRKGHLRVAGLDISIENPAGSVRRGTDKQGKAWENTLSHHYGYVRGTVGRDKDHLDIFVTPGVSGDYSGPVFVVDQIDPDTRRFDEHKLVLGAATRDEAEAIYHANYASDWRGFGGITEMTLDQFKGWIAGDTTKPLSARARVDATRRAEPADTGLPAAKLSRLVELTGRTREEVARQFSGFVAAHGRERADQMLDQALERAQQRPKPEPKPEPDPEPEKTPEQSPAPQEAESQAQDLAADGDRGVAPAPGGGAPQAAPSRAGIIALRKREAVLKRLKECLK